MLTDKQKAANRKWKKKNIRFYGANVGIEVGMEFERLCAKMGKNTNQVLQEYIRQFVLDQSGIKDRETVSRRVEYDRALFEALYVKVKSGEITIKSAYEQLGMNYIKWHRLCKAKEASES